jgi:MFS family permease
MLAALKVVDFRYLLAGNLVSNLGSWLLVVAIPYQVFRLTDSTAATGLALAAESLPALLVGPVAGVFVDRWDRRRLMIATDLVSAVAVTGMLLADRPDRLGWLYLALVVENLGIVFFRPAARALVPATVGTGPVLSSANSLLALNNGIVRLAGPPLGALLLTAFGLRTVVLADVASYLVSTVAITATRRRVVREDAPVRSVAALVGELLAGLRFTWWHRTLRGLFVVNTIFFTANGVFTALLIPFMSIRFGDRPGATGFLLSALGVGYLLGAPLAGRLVRRRPPGVLLLAGQAGVGLCFAALADAPDLTVAFVAIGLAGLPASLLLVTIETTIQRGAPDAMRGRIGATFFASDAAAALLGALLGVLFGARDHLPAVLTAGACVILLGAVLGSLMVRLTEPFADPVIASARRS